MGIDIKVDDRGMQKLAGRVGKIEERLKDLTPVMRGRAAALDSVIQRQVFGKSQSPEGDKWLPSFAKSGRTKHGGSTFRAVKKGKTLIDTGNLKDSIATQGTKEGVLVGLSGSATRYGLVHQFGGKHHPERPFLPVDETGTVLLKRGPMAEWAKRFAERVSRYLVSGKV